MIFKGNIVHLYLVLMLCILKVNCYKILCIFPTPSKSHWLIGSAVCKNLAEANHDITMVSAYELKPPMQNYRDVLLSGLAELSEARHKQLNILEMRNLPIPALLFILYQMGTKVTEYTLNHTNVLPLFNEKFDLVIVQSFCVDSLLGFGQLYNAPVITVATFGASKFTNDIIGVPAPLSYVPHSFLSYTDQMTFYQRFMNALTTIIENIFMEFYYFPTQKRIYNKHFPNPKPEFEEVFKKGVSLVFVNSHFSLSFPKPYLPNLIEIGGIQIDRNLKKLPKEIQDFLDTAENGAIYFSMGSHIKATNFPSEKLQAFIQAFSKYEGKVIWKFEDENLPNKPDNVMISKWLPQNEILAHPNLKLFISHGGLLSSTESIYNGIPIIGIPIYGDQQLNIARAELSGWGVKLPYDNISESTVTYSIQKVLSNPSYTENAKTIGFRYRDQPLTPVQTLIYWVEYVCRHKGAPHLKSSGQNLNFIQYNMIDVYFIMFLIALLSTIVWYISTKSLLKLIYNKIKSKTTNKVKVN